MYRAEGAVEHQCDENQTQTCHDRGNSETQNFHATTVSTPPTLLSLSFRIFEVLAPLSLYFGTSEVDFEVLALICDRRST